ncbi:Acyl-thioesterase 1 [Hyphodiscus hymeniophilus]|uniref:Acyl-thioesterase 1 n=1 Tax=Hyphodiscus hymeniophilus TaxID=353542 RepID=A0A9P6VFN7_9HELO|nr:Acyl-thioesterase 1 [Hyphodiscus hymeniophilus]
MDAINDIHTVAALEQHTHTVIFLHGRDSEATQFADEFFESQDSADRFLPQTFPSIKWVFPSSGSRKSLRFGEELSQWFDMWSVEEPSERKEIQLDGLRESVAFTLDIVRRESTIVPPERIILAGISQGCATAIFALLSGGIRLGGFIGLSSWLPFQDEIKSFSKNLELEDCNIPKEIEVLLEKGLGKSGAENVNQGIGISRGSDSALTTPVFLSHSQEDPVVPVRNGQGLCEGLKELGMSVIWKEYEDDTHWIFEPQGVDDIVEFISAVL